MIAEIKTKPSKFDKFSMEADALIKAVVPPKHIHKMRLSEAKDS